MEPFAPRAWVRRAVTVAQLACLTACAALPLSVTPGCARHTLPPSPPPPASPRHASARAAAPAHVQQTPEYREAGRLYARHDYADARAALDRVKPGADWTEEDRAYLERQKGIVESGKWKVVSGAGAGEGGKLRVGRGGAAEVGGQPLAPGSRSPETSDCGPRALLVVCAKLGVRADLAELRRLAGTTGIGTTMEGLAKAARAKGLSAEGVQMNRAALAALDRPAVAWVGGDHYIAVLKIGGVKAQVHNPNEPAPKTISTEELLRESGGILLTIKKSAPGVGAGGPLPPPPHSDRPPGPSFCGAEQDRTARAQPRRGQAVGLCPTSLRDNNTRGGFR